MDGGYANSLSAVVVVVVVKGTPNGGEGREGNLKWE